MDDSNNYFDNISMYSNSAKRSNNKQIKYALMENIKASAEEYLKRYENDI